MINRTSFVWTGAVLTLALGVAAWLECYSQEAARSARHGVLQNRDAAAQTDQLAAAPVVVQLPATER